jgi:hypothetical protein
MDIRLSDYLGQGGGGTSGTGTSGTSGTGTSGTSGSVGGTGSSGTSGIGTSGTSGSVGGTGSSGTSSTSGTSGGVGETGSSGTSGITSIFTINASLGTSLLSNGIQSTFYLGEDVSFGDVLYLNTNGAVYKADASISTKVPVIGMSLEHKTATNDVSVLLQGSIRYDTWNFTKIGQQVYLNRTPAGKLVEDVSNYISGNTVQVIGTITHPNRILFNPDTTIIEIV